MSDRRVSIGAAGEAIAAWWLTERGFQVEDRNIFVERDEIDILATAPDGGAIAVEVRAVTGPGDPIEAIDNTKRSHVRRVAARAGVGRIGFVALRLGPDALEVHWVPG